MIDYYQEGVSLRSQMKKHVLAFMNDTPVCASSSEGMRTTQLFEQCGFNWDDQENAESTKQQYFMVALLRVLETEGKIQRDPISKKWRLR